MNLKAIFPTGITELTVNGLHQWDYGRKLEIHAADLPALVEIHFACPGMDEAIVRVGSAVGGVVTVSIPDRCLEQYAPITAWVYEVGETYGQTIKALTLNIMRRARPQVAETLTPEICDKYTEAVGAMNEAIARMPEQFLPKTGGRIDGRLFVDGDLLEVGSIYGGKNAIAVTYLSGQLVGLLSLFGNGSLANKETDTNGIRGLYDHKLEKNIIEIGKDDKVKFNGEAETAKAAKTAESADILQSALNHAESADNYLLLNIYSPGIYVVKFTTNYKPNEAYTAVFFITDLAQKVIPGGEYQGFATVEYQPQGIDETGVRYGVIALQSEEKTDTVNADIVCIAQYNF